MQLNMKTKEAQQNCFIPNSNKMHSASTKLIHDKNVSNAIISTTPYRTLDTGQIQMRFRVSRSFLVVEYVLLGYKKNFLDSVEVFHLDGYNVGKRYQIRNEEVLKIDTISSFHIVLDMMSKFLHKSSTIRIKTELEELYSVEYHDWEFEAKADIIANFIK